VVTADVVFAVPGSLETPTGGYAYDRRVIAELGALGCRADVLDLGDGFPYPTDSTRAAAAALLARVVRGTPIVVDGLALGVLPEAAAAMRTTHPLIGLVHHPLALETGLSPAEADVFRASERAALVATRHVIVPSPATARALVSNYGVAPDRITVAPPGTDPVARATGSTDGAVALLAVGSLVPRKGYDTLLEALANVADLPWRLTIVGDPSRAPETAARLTAQIARTDIGDRVTLAGAVPAHMLTQFYSSADLFVLPSRHEGYGMAFAEAIAHGVPVVGTTAGAIPETVPPDAGVLVPPDDVAALTAVLRQLIADTAGRAVLAAGARAAAGALPTWPATARLFHDVIAKLTTRSVTVDA